MMSAEARVRRLETELESLRRSTRVALEESWQEVERLESENTYREEKILALQGQLAEYMHKETEEDLARDSTSTSSSQSPTPVSPVGSNSVSVISRNEDDNNSLEQRIEINFPCSNPMRSLLSSTRQSSMRSLVSLGSRQGSFRSTSPMNSLRSGMRTCNVGLLSLSRSDLNMHESEKIDLSDGGNSESFPISNLGSQLRSGLKKCSSFKVKSKDKPTNEPTEMEKALLRQLEYLQEEKKLDVEELEMKLEQRDVVIESLEAKLEAQESTIKELQLKMGDLRKKVNRSGGA